MFIVSSWIVTFVQVCNQLFCIMHAWFSLLWAESLLQVQAARTTHLLDLFNKTFVMGPDNKKSNVLYSQKQAEKANINS